jgi:long-chain acyl-CoA synthetase
MQGRGIESEGHRRDSGGNQGETNRGSACCLKEDACLRASLEIRTETHWGRTMRCFTQRPATVDAMFRAAVARAPRSCAMVDGAVRTSYAALDAMVDACAAGLARRGVAPGDRVAVFLGNCPEAVIATLGIARLGAMLTPVGARLRRPELEYVVADAQPVALIYDAAFAGELPQSDARRSR